MSAIDEIIARARQPGSFSEHKRFTLARDRAIAKMREFALADPTHYVLELIQSAIANGATAVDIWVQPTELLFAYFGGSLNKHEMAHLFDFLFASQDAVGVGHLRSLALGLNALMRFRPHQVVLESGDGTADRTYRMVIDPTNNQVDVGLSKAPLRGTFISARGLKRGPQWGEGERNAVETRCLAAPVPIVFNGDAPFGYGSHRLPTLWNYERVTYFDEGDLYGGVGWNPEGPPVFRLLTYGVWVQSHETTLVKGHSIGGIINFDRLRKTADHAAFVQDARFSEMWLRARPYALRGLLDRHAPTLREVRTLEGDPVPPSELRQYLVKCGTVMVVDAAVAKKEAAAVKMLAEHLGVTGLVCPHRHLLSLRYLAGDAASVITPLPTSGPKGTLAQVLPFYRQPEAPPPPQPHLTTPLAATFSVEAVAKELAGHEATAVKLDAQRELLGGDGQITVTLYAPADDHHTRDGTFVEVLTSGRVALGCVVPSAYRGQWMRIALPHVSPLMIRRDADEPHGFGNRLAHTVLRMTASLQEHLNQRILAQLTQDGVSSRKLACLALDEATRVSIVRLRRDARGVPRLHVEAFKGRAALLDYPALRTLTGEWRSLRQVVQSAAHTGGLVYGAVGGIEADLEGLDRSRVLDLDLDTETTLIRLLGEANYVRVDKRDVLARWESVRIRDIALGLRSYPAGPLLLENSESSLGQEGYTRLLQQLVRCYLGWEPRAPVDPQDFAGWEENRRQACRHLQWAACRQVIDGGAHFSEETRKALLNLPLFATPSGPPASMGQVCEALQQGPLSLTHRAELGTPELASLAAAAAEGQRREAPPQALAVSAFAAQLLHEVARSHNPKQPGLSLSFDLELPTEGPGNQASYLHSVPITGEGLHGVLGLRAPDSTEERAGVLLLNAQNRPTARYDVPGFPAELSGYVVLEEGAPNVGEDAVAAAVERATEDLARQLVARLGQERRNNNTPHFERFVLHYAASSLLLQADEHGTVTPSVLDPLAHSILNLSLFPTRAGRVSAWWLIVEFANYGASAFEDATRDCAVRQFLAHTEGQHLRSWVVNTLHESRVVRPRTVEPPAPVDLMPQDADLAQTLRYWLSALRPDTLGSGFIRVHLSSLGLLFRSDALLTCRVRYGLDITVNRHHWLVQQVADLLDEPKGPDAPAPAEALAWLLLAAYAEINRCLGPITNEHEWEFQRRVLEKLKRGELCFVAA